jgi:hypothetical protein
VRPRARCASGPKLTIVLVHSAWADSGSWNAVTNQFRTPAWATIQSWDIVGMSDHIIARPSSCHPGSLGHRPTLVLRDLLTDNET